MKQQTTPLTPFKPKASDFPPALALPYTVKANFKGYFIWLGFIRPVIALALLGLLFWSNVWYGLTALVLIVVILSVTALLVGQRQVTLGESELLFKNAVGKTTMTSYDEMKAVHVFINYFDAGFGIVPRIFIEKVDGTRIAAMNTLFWPAEGLDALLSGLRAKKVKVLYYKDVLQRAQIYATLPGLSTYTERHPVFIGFVVAVGIVAVVSVFVLLTMPR